MNDLCINLDTDHNIAAWHKAWLHVMKSYTIEDGGSWAVMERWLRENYSCKVVEEPQTFGGVYYYLHFSHLSDKVAFELTWV